MGHFHAGRQEQVRCIQDVDIHGKDGELLCLAYKTTTFHVGAGAYFRDDGYVLKAREWHQDRYYPLEHDDIVKYQAEGTLPTPLPAYTIPLGDYIWGFFLWIVVAGTIAASLVRRYRQAKRRQKAEALLATEGSATGAQTETDAFVSRTVKPLLRAGERALHHGYAVDGDVESAGAIGALFARGLFVVITTERVILLSSRLALLGPAMESRGVESIERSAILDSGLDSNTLVLVLKEGERRFAIKVNESTLANQRTFARDALRELSSSPRNA